jgi:hypothetical protein
LAEKEGGQIDLANIYIAENKVFGFKENGLI